jgi:sporulation protein YlmC with PRC-barrel domain
MTDIDLALKVLDHQILDCEGRRCGNVDDLAIEGDRVTAILVGPGVWPQRARLLGRIAGFVGGGSRVRIPWEEVRDVESHVVLRKTAAEYGLGKGDDRVRPWIARLPGADR